MTGNSRLIVVGVDGSEGSRKALQWAVHEAHDRGGHVQALAAWRWDDLQVPGRASTEAAHKRAEAMLAHEVESLPLFQLSAPPIACEVVEGRPAEVLVARPGMRTCWYWAAMAAAGRCISCWARSARSAYAMRPARWWCCPPHYEHRHETNPPHRFADAA